MTTTPLWQDYRYLQKHPELVMVMDMEDIKVFRTHNKGTHCPDVRQLVKTREDELKAWEQHDRLLARIDKLHLRIEHIYRYASECADDLEGSDPRGYKYQDIIDVSARNIGNMIHDLPRVSTGLISVELCLDLKDNPHTQVVHEHFIPRSGVGGKDILDLAAAGRFEMKDLIDVLYARSMCNKTTQRENRIALPPYQKFNTFIDPAESYRQAEIKLIREKDFSIPETWQGVADLYGITLTDPPDFDTVDPNDYL